MQKGTGTSALVAAERRIGAEVDAALKKRSPLEAKVAGAARALAPHSVAVRGQLVVAGKELVKKDAFDRELYGVAMRALAETQDKRLASVLLSALKADDHGGLGALTAACFSEDPALAPHIARAAASPKTQIAFAAEVARTCRGEPTGARLAALAPRIKEAHRIALCVDLLLPLAIHQRRVSEKACAGMAEALHVLRGSERHLGRWLVMAEIAHRGGDERPLKEAVERTTTGPDSSRAAWALVAWALDPSRGTGGTRPTSELVARLSHRPSADRDTSFLFRLAAARLDVARPMLEALARTKPLGDEVALRAAFVLAKNYERAGFVRDVLEAADAAAREELRGIAAAALWDLGERAKAVALAEALATATDLGAQTWAGLVHAAASAPTSRQPSELVTEQNFRRIQWGWIE
jgi:hypothetical protein